MKERGDGGSTSYYELPSGAKELQDLIEHKDMNFARGNIFKACYALDERGDPIRDLNKIIWFAIRLREEYLSSRKTTSLEEENETLAWIGRVQDWREVSSRELRPCIMCESNEIKHIPKDSYDETVLGLCSICYGRFVEKNHYNLSKEQTENGTNRPGNRKSNDSKPSISGSKETGGTGDVKDNRCERCGREAFARGDSEILNHSVELCNECIQSFIESTAREVESVSDADSK